MSILQFANMGGIYDKVQPRSQIRSNLLNDTTNGMKNILTAYDTESKNDEMENLASQLEASDTNVAANDKLASQLETLRAELNNQELMPEQRDLKNLQIRDLEEQMELNKSGILGDDRKMQMMQTLASKYNRPDFLNAYNAKLAEQQRKEDVEYRNKQLESAEQQRKEDVEYRNKQLESAIQKEADEKLAEQKAKEYETAKARLTHKLVNKITEIKNDQNIKSDKKLEQIEALKQGYLDEGLYEKDFYDILNRDDELRKIYGSSVARSTTPAPKKKIVELNLQLGN